MCHAGMPTDPPPELGYSDIADRYREGAKALAQAERERVQEAKHVRFTEGVKWTFNPLTLMWQGSNNQCMEWDNLAPLVAEWEAGEAERTLRKDIMNRLTQMGEEELDYHLNMCRLSVEIAEKMGLTTPV